MTIPPIYTTPVAILIPRRYTRPSNPPDFAFPFSNMRELVVRHTSPSRHHFPFLSFSLSLSLPVPLHGSNRTGRFQEEHSQRTIRPPIPTGSIFRCARKIELPCIHSLAPRCAPLLELMVTRTRRYGPRLDRYFIIRSYRFASARIFREYFSKRGRPERKRVNWKIGRAIVN